MFEIKNEKIAIPVVLFAGLLWSFGPLIVRYMDQPKENEEGYEKASLLNKTDQLKGKLLLIHGTSDDVVVMQHNLKLVQKFVESEKQIDFFL
mgnify:CR=1 FL=1